MGKHQRIVGSFWTLLLLLPVSNLQSAEPAQPNVILFLVDDLGWSDVGCFGSSFYETPNIDRLGSTIRQTATPHWLRG